MAKYYITVGDFVINATTYPDRCIAALEVGEGIPSDVIPWESHEHSPYDYRAIYELVETKTEEGTYYTKKYTGEFVLDIIPVPTPEPSPTDMDRITAQLLYTATMTDTLLAKTMLGE